jgi:hypothetical protein
MPEQPPPGWPELGMNPLYHEKRFDNLTALDAYCRANHVSANDAYNKHGLLACVIPSAHEVVLPEQGLLRDPAKETALAVHEYGHSWNLVHHDGKDWYYPDGRKAGPITPATRQMMLAMALAGARQAQAAEPPKGLLALGASTLPPEGAR